MGTLKDGILGGFSGRIGNLVGATWKDIHYIRTLPAKVRDPKTEKQLSQRSFLTTSSKPHTSTFLSIGYTSDTGATI